MSSINRPELLASRVRPEPWLVFGVASALAVGATSGVSTTTGVALACLIALVTAAVFRPTIMAHVLIGSMFLEVIAVGGVNIARILAPVALFVVALELIRGGAFLRLGLPLIAASAYATWALASGLWTQDLVGTLFMLGSLFVALAFMITVAVLITSERALLTSLLVLALMSLLVGFYSVAAYGGFVGGNSSALEAGRAQGGLTSPNYFASLMLVALPLIALVATETKTPWLRYLLYGSALGTLGSVLTTLSRGGLFALLVLLIAMVFVPGRTMFPSPRYKVAVLLVLALAMGVFLSRQHLRYELTDRVLSVFASQESEEADPSGGGRTELWKAARHSVAERPMLGLGFGAFYSQAIELLHETPGVRLNLVTIEDKEVHNAYLGTATELGVPGLAFFISVLVATAFTLRSTAKRARRMGAQFVGRVATALLLSLLAWSVSALFIEAETARPLWVIVGLSLALPRLLDDRTRDALKRRAPAANGLRRVT